MSQILEEYIPPIQQQEQEELTFEEICPQHSQQIQMWDNLTPYAKSKFVSIIQCSAQRCVVGEAHDFSSDYINNCDDCCDFANFESGFPLAFSKTGIPNWEKFEEIKSRFVGHYNRVHRKD
jgi:hypothetical protein